MHKGQGVSTFCYAFALGVKRLFFKKKNLPSSNSNGELCIDIPFPFPKYSEDPPGPALRGFLQLARWLGGCVLASRYCLDRLFLAMLPAGGTSIRCIQTRNWLALSYSLGFNSDICQLEQSL